MTSFQYSCLLFFKFSSKFSKNLNLGLWSNERLIALPASATTQRESPALAHIKLLLLIRRTLAVQPIWSDVHPYWASYLYTLNPPFGPPWFMIDFFTGSMCSGNCYEIVSRATILILYYKQIFFKIDSLRSHQLKIQPYKCILQCFP